MAPDSSSASRSRPAESRTAAGPENKKGRRLRTGLLNSQLVNYEDGRGTSVVRIVVVIVPVGLEKRTSMPAGKIATPSP